MTSRGKLKQSFILLIIISIIVIFLIFALSLRPSELHPLSPESHHRNKEPIRQFKILLWTPFFGQKDYIPPSWKDSCDYKNCQFTSNKRYFNQSDAVMFHLRDLEPHEIPRHRPSSKQRWILLHHESPEHTPKATLKAFNNLINWTATYRRESEIFLSPRFVETDSQKSLNLPEIELNRSGQVSWLVSNCETPGKRELFVDILSRYIKVDIYGKCGTKQCLPKMSDQCYDKLSNDYYFYLSFENSICPDYVTEKFFSILNYPIVPAVFGGADYDKFAPPNSYINSLKFESPQKLAEYLKHLIDHPEEYKRYFDWKSRFKQEYEHYSCQICRLLNTKKDTFSVWKDLISWWFKEAPCSSWQPQTAYE